MKYTVIGNLFYCLDQMLNFYFLILEEYKKSFIIFNSKEIIIHVYFFVGHINNLYNTCFWKLVQERGLTPAQSQEKLKVSIE